MSDKKIRRVSHFPDEKLERQFDEIVDYITILNKEIEEDIKPPSSDEEGVNIVEPTIPDDDFKVPSNFNVHMAFKRAILNWDVNFSGTVYYYQVEFSMSHIDSTEWGAWQRIKGQIVASFYVHENLDLNYEYRYRVRAVAKDGRYSKWTNSFIGGVPGKVSLSEEVVGELIGDYLADGAVTESKFNTQVIEKYVHEQSDGNLSVIAKTPSEISSTVAEVHDGGAISGSTIQQNSDNINLRVVALDENGDPTTVNAQFNISQVDGNGYVYLAGDQITLDGNTNIDGNFEVSGGNVHITSFTQFDNDVTIKGTLDGVDGNFSGELTATDFKLYSGQYGGQLEFYNNGFKIVEIGNGQASTINQINNTGTIKIYEENTTDSTIENDGKFNAFIGTNNQGIIVLGGYNNYGESMSTGENSYIIGQTSNSGATMRLLDEQKDTGITIEADRNEKRIASGNYGTGSSFTLTSNVGGTEGYSLLMVDNVQTDEVGNGITFDIAEDQVFFNIPNAVEVGQLGYSVTHEPKLHIAGTANLLDLHSDAFDYKYFQKFRVQGTPYWAFGMDSGNLILDEIDDGTHEFEIRADNIKFSNLSTTIPAEAGRLYKDSNGFVKIS